MCWPWIVGKSPHPPLQRAALNRWTPDCVLSHFTQETWRTLLQIKCKLFLYACICSVTMFPVNTPTLKTR